MTDVSLMNGRLETLRPPVEAAFAAAVRDSQLAMVVVDARADDHPIIYLNEAFSALTGYPPDEVLGRNCRFLQGPGTDPADIERVRRIVRGGRAAQVDILNYHRDGSPFWNALYISPVQDAAGDTAFFFGAQIDVSERKLAEHALHAVKTSLESVAEATADDLRRALAHRTALLHEVDHRVKNNLQLIASLMMLQIRRTPEPAAKAALKSMLSRVSAVSTAHRRLFQNPDVERFEIGAFLRDLVEDRFGLTADDEALELDVAAATLPNAKAAPLALILGEMLNHTLDVDADERRLKLTAVREGGDLRITLEGLAALGDGDAFGREIVDLLARQLQGKARLEELNGLRRAYLLIPMDGSE